MDRGVRIEEGNLRQTQRHCFRRLTHHSSTTRNKKPARSYTPYLQINETTGIVVGLRCARGQKYGLFCFSNVFLGGYLYGSVFLWRF